MKHFITCLFAFSALSFNISAQNQLSTADLTNLYKSTSSKQISVHDPSVFFDTTSKQYFIFGSHYYGGKSKNLRDWTEVKNYYSLSYDKAFKSNPTHTVNRILPGGTNSEQVTLGSFDAAAFCATYATVSEAQWVSGDQWAPDVVYNPNMGKYCYYLSLNGDNWASVIVLMTSDNIEGPYTYQAPIVFGGFNGQSYSGKSVDYKKTDLELVLGAQSSLPSRYNTNQWGSYYPNCIDPCVFYDETGELWLAYGSWSGGIFMLKLDKNTGLRDYTTTYTGTGTKPDAKALSDAYFGKKIAGGHYVSGEGPYIQHIGDYYYLFMSYGGFAPDGGYEMRVFRSENPDGPYKDANGVTATYADQSGWILNYGSGAKTNRGMKLIGAMNKWGLMTTGECAQGHNSACTDDQGRSFLVCHTKFNDGTLGHRVRSYQLFLNQNGWLCTAPFQFNGETLTDDSIATVRKFSVDEVAGQYHVLIHPYKLDHSVYQEATPDTIRLTADGKVRGAYTGSWKYTDEGKGYFQITLAGVPYNGVVTEQTLENNTAKAICFTAVCDKSGNASCGVPVWGYKLEPKYAVASNYAKLKDKSLRSSAVSSISKNTQLYYDTDENTTLTWTSSNPDVVSNTGKYNPDTTAISLTLTARLECGDYYWENTYTARAQKASEIVGDQTTGLVAYYNFDDKTSSTYNELTPNEGRMTFGRSSTTDATAAKIVDDYARFGTVAHQFYGDNGKNSYMKIDNPLAQANNSDLNGFTVSLWVNRVDANDNFNALWSFFGGNTASANGPRLYLTGNSYLGFNDNAGNWFDVNYPERKIVSKLTAGEWNLFTLTYSLESGYMLYVNGNKYLSSNLDYRGSVNTEAEFNRQLVIDFVKSAKFFYLGLGSFWGSADAYFDDLMIYNRALSDNDVKGLASLMNRVNKFDDGSYAESVTSIEGVISTTDSYLKDTVFDLMGRPVSTPANGIYIVNGKKKLFK